MRYEAIWAAIVNEPWAIRPSKLEAICAFVQARAAGQDAAPIPVMVRRGPGRPTAIRGATAVLPLFGTISHRQNMMTETSGGTSTELFARDFQAAVADPAVGAIVLDVDSPGGSVTGVQELSDAIFAARQAKPIIAIANASAASAAYWIGSAASEFVVTPSGEVGSIGVIAVHTDYSGAETQAGMKTTIISAGEHKTEGNPFEPLGDDARSEIQRVVNIYYDRFVASVARNRGVTRGIVESQFGRGRMLVAEEARAAGMVDRVESFDALLGRLSRRQAAKTASAAAASRVAMLRLDMAARARYDRATIE